MNRQVSVKINVDILVGHEVKKCQGGISKNVTSHLMVLSCLIFFLHQNSENCI